jgi:excisionase family DNA binding protein
MKYHIHLAGRRGAARMTTDHDSELLTIAEAAKLLKVSTITLHRWLKAGRLTAYHVGPKAVRIRRRDLEGLLTPIHRREVTAMQEHEPHTTQGQTRIRPLTDEEVQRGWEAFKASEALLAEQLARRGGVPFAASWPLIREARDEREQRLGTTR